MIVTEEHLRLLDRMRFDWDDELEFGGIASDFKRPYGNSDVVDDVSGILGREVDWTEAKRLTIELSAIVNAAIRVALARRTVLGADLALPWRAERLLRRL